MKKENWAKRYLMIFVDPTNAAMLGGLIAIIVVVIITMMVRVIIPSIPPWPVFFLWIAVTLLSGVVHGWAYNRFVTWREQFEGADVLIAKNPDDGTYTAGKRVWARKMAAAPIHLPNVRKGKFTFTGRLRNIPLAFEGVMESEAKEDDPLRGFSARELYNVASFGNGKAFDVEKYLADRFVEAALAFKSIKVNEAFAKYESATKEQGFSLEKSQKGLELMTELLPALHAVTFRPTEQAKLWSVSKVRVTMVASIFVGTYG